MTEPVEIRTSSLGFEYGVFDELDSSDVEVYGASGKKGCLELLLILWLPVVLAVIRRYC